MSISSIASVRRASPMQPFRKCWLAISAHTNGGARNSSPWARRSAEAPVGCYCRGLRATASSSINGHPITVTRWLAARRFSRWICTSIPITSISAPKPPIMLAPSWRQSTGQQYDARMTEFGHELPNDACPYADYPFICDDLRIHRTPAGKVQIAWRKGNPHEGRPQGHYRNASLG